VTATQGDILIWGAGAIGGTVGAFLRRAGRDVSFVDIVPEHVAAIRDPARGLAITGPVDAFAVTAPAMTPQAVAGSWQRIFLAVKAHHTEAACHALAPHLAADGYVLSLQNGLCEKIISAIVGPARTMGAFVNFGADWLAPGEILYANRGAVVLGEIDGRMTSRLRDLHAELRDFEPEAIVTDDIWSYLWGKLGYGALLFAQALGQLGIADCLARPELLPLWRRLAGEAMEVALAEGVEPRGFNGFDPNAFRPGASAAEARRSIDAMVAFNRPNAKTHSGVWRDLAIRRRPTEIDVQIAPIAEIGARHDLACPAVRALVRMIHEVERGARPMTDANLDELMRVSGRSARAPRRGASRR
jgi:2-dehydropantoate 2-reductase